MTMTEHAFDPIPDEQDALDDFIAHARRATDILGSLEANDKPAPNATVTVKQLRDAIKAGRWEHDDPTTALWLNTSFPPAGREAAELIVELTAHGIACS
jgi:hypothetical protein